MLLNSHISAYARCLAGKVCGLVRSTWGTSLGENKPGARDRILNTKGARRANIPSQVFGLGVSCSVWPLCCASRSITRGSIFGSSVSR